MTAQDLTLHNRVLDQAQRLIYAALADILIPNAEGMPSASDADVPTRWVNDTLDYRPDLIAPLRDALALAADHEPRDAIEILHSQHPHLFETLGTVTAGSYFLNPEIKARIGYPGQVPAPLRDDSEEYFDMLERVVDRGPIYRTVPADTE